jgi:hypothetical protein
MTLFFFSPEKESSYINITNTDTNDHMIEAYVGDKNIQWVVNFKAYPTPTTILW